MTEEVKSSSRLVLRHLVTGIVHSNVPIVHIPFDLAIGDVGERCLLEFLLAGPFDLLSPPEATLPVANPVLVAAVNVDLNATL